ncbi:MAG: hypothetical protein JW863_03930 [Chitinispirillaceae bacterium]|nr:hypothetical protein [Chitinispirillaceae bacterium]
MDSRLLSEHLNSAIGKYGPRLIKFFSTGNTFVRHHPLAVLAAGVFICFLILPAAVPHQGKILPVDPYMVTAYSMLNSTSTGRQLIKRVKKSTAGSYIYLSLGSTDKDRLTDWSGDTVRGVTRATYEQIDRLLLPKSVTVITNKDLVGTAPRDIIRSIAYELENVDFSFRNPQFDFPADSPLAEHTQRRILEELNL